MSQIFINFPKKKKNFKMKVIKNMYLSGTKIIKYHCEEDFF